MSSRDETIDDSVISELNYLYHKNKDHSPLVYFLLSMVGFFHKPFRPIVTSCLVIIIFGISFYSIKNFDNRMLTLSELLNPNIMAIVLTDLIDSVYFSGITFFTIGYSDIIGESNSILEPTRKLLILLEAGIGIILTSVF